MDGENLEMTEKLVSEVTKEYRSKSKWKLEIDTYILMSSCFLFFCPNVAPGRFRISSSCQITFLAATYNFVLTGVCTSAKS